MFVFVYFVDVQTSLMSWTFSQRLVCWVTYNWPSCLWDRAEWACVSKNATTSSTI